MRRLIVAVPCVCCCRCSRHYSTSAWHQCLFQFHLIALVIKLGTDTTHHIIALITSELQCVHMTISLTQTPIPSLCLCPPLPILPAPALFPANRFDPVIHPSHTAVQRPYSNKWLSLCHDSFNGYREYLMQSYSSSGQSVALVEVTNSDGEQECRFLSLCRNRRKKTHHASTISYPPGQRDMYGVVFLSLDSWGNDEGSQPATMIIDGCV